MDSLGSFQVLSNNLIEKKTDFALFIRSQKTSNSKIAIKSDFVLKLLNMRQPSLFKICRNFPLEKNADSLTNPKIVPNLIYLDYRT